jgi:integrin-linked kinase-associated serine/threonine phosphatase 2C
MCHPSDGWALIRHFNKKNKYKYRYVLLACDGLWKSFKNEEAVNFINSLPTSKQLAISADENNERRDHYELACNKIANDAVKKLTADNVTVLIISIGVK